jgi:PKD repeat protein
VRFILLPTYQAAEIIPAPTARIVAYPRSGNSPLAVQFASPGQYQTYWYWHIDDGGYGWIESEERNPLITLTNGGATPKQYNVFLYVEGPGGWDWTQQYGCITVWP